MKNNIYFGVQLFILLGVFLAGAAFFTLQNALAQDSLDGGAACIDRCETDFNACEADQLAESKRLDAEFRTRYDAASECSLVCLDAWGDTNEACSEAKYACWNNILERKNPDGTWACRNIVGVFKACELEGETNCDAVEKACYTNAEQTHNACLDACGYPDRNAYLIADQYACYERRNACYDACGDTSKPPEDQKSDTSADDALEKERSSFTQESKIRLDVEFTPALLEFQPKAEDLPDYDEESSKEEDKFYLIGTPYGPFVGRDLESRGVRVDYGIAFTQIKGGNPEIILPDGSKLDYTYRSFADLRQIPLGAKIVTPPGAEIKIKFIMSRLPESEKNPLFSPATLPNPKLRPGDRKLSIQMGENSQITFDQMYRGFAKIVVNKGDVRFKHKLFQLQAASETGVGIITKGTDYGIAYYPESKQTVIEIYDGGIEIADLNTKKILTTLSTSYGEPIKSVEVAEDKMIIEKIAIPRSEWDAFVAKTEKGKSPAAWRWGAALLIIGSIGYFAYRKKDAFMEFFKKQPRQ